MNDNSDLLPNLVHEDAFEMQMRGYSRRQVDEFIARCRSQIRDLEQRLARSRLPIGQPGRRAARETSSRPREPVFIQWCSGLLAQRHNNRFGPLADG